MATIPSLALLPSGYKVSKVYSVLPTDGSGDFTFTRSGNATRVNSEGLIEVVSTNVPRLNYPLIDGVVQGCPSLLLEPQRINLVHYSQDFSNAYWSKSTSDSTPVPVVTSNYAISPDGTQNAERVQLTLPTDNQYAIIERAGLNPNAALGSIIYQSIYLKATDISQVGKKVDVYIYDTTNSSYRRIFNHVLTNDWERIESNNLISFGLTSTSVIYAFGKARGNAAGQAGTTGTITSEAATDFLVWGAQLEAGSYPTSYIPTQGATATRVAETCVKNNIDTSIISSSYPFTMYVESTYIVGNEQLLSFINSSVANNYYAITINSNVVNLDARANGLTELISSGVSLVNGQKFKAAITMQSATSGKICVNGNTVISKTNFTSQDSNVNINDLLLGQLRIVSDTGQRLPVSDVKIYNTSLTDLQLQQLTTL